MVNKQSPKFKRIRNYYITVLFILVMCVPSLFVVFRVPKEISIRENRILNQLPTFSVSSYLSHAFQDDMENAIQDQLLGSGTMKYVYNQLKSFVTLESYQLYDSILLSFDNQNTIEDVGDPVSDSISVDISDWGYNLIPLGNNIMRIEETGNLIIANNPEEEWMPAFETKVNNINYLADMFPDVVFNVYYIETDHDVNFIGYENSHSITNYLDENLNDEINLGVQFINSLDDYKNFYQSDHHWNQDGQVIGYRNAVELLGQSPNEAVYTKVLEDSNYVGSRARSIDNYDINDAFGLVYIDDLDYTTRVNGQPANYNNKYKYVEGVYNIEEGINHYAICYGYDVGLIQYDFNHDEKENILMLTASFSNPINELIASHFNHTFVVDLRHYQEDMGHAFEMDSFLEENDIDQVLYLGYYTFYAKPEFLVPIN